MNCPRCGRLAEPGDEYCIVCGEKLNSYYKSDFDAYDDRIYPDDYPADPVKRPQNNTALYVIVAVLATALIGLVGWLLLNHYQGNAGPQGPSTTVETQTPPPAETVYVTVTPEQSTSSAVKTGGYLLPESSSRRVTDAELSQLTHEELCFARNEIYARHGRIFDTPQVANYFESKSWYSGTIPASRFNESVLTSTERANVDIIYAYEKSHYGGSYY